MWNEPIDNGAVNFHYELSINWNNQNGVSQSRPNIIVKDRHYCHDVVMGLNYTYVVKAVNAIGTSENSNVLTLQAGTNPCPPSFVRTELNQNRDKAIITWNPAPCDNGLMIQGYKIFIREGQ